MRDHLTCKIGVYEVEYRIRTKGGKYKWYYDRGKITKYDQTGKPVFLAGIVFDITEKKVIQQELENKNKLLAEQSALDGLTKISNHSTIVEHLKSEIAASNHSKEPLAVALFDIDDFKKVNDSKGHIFGDRVLVEIAGIIQSKIRKSDLVGRYGGEEFLVVFSNTDLEMASMIGERIRQSIENHCFEPGLKITISGGVKQYAGEEITALIHAADMKLYDAKKSGKNRVVS